VSSTGKPMRTGAYHRSRGVGRRFDVVAGIKADEIAAPQLDPVT
jgi:hypothetical protein